MRAALALPVIVSTGILGVLAGAAIVRRGHSPAAGTANFDPAAAAGLEERLRALESRIELLSSLEAEVQRLGATASVSPPSDPAAEPSREEASPEAREEAEEGAVADAASRPTRLERWLDANGMREDLEQFVGQAYLGAREQRRVKEQRDAEERAREMEELSKGPYGKHNYQVNSMAKKLDLDARQQDYLFNLLTGYEDRAREAKAQIFTAEGGKPSPEALEQMMKQYASVKDGFRSGIQDDFFASLRPEQREVFETLPEGERTLGMSPDMRDVLGGLERRAIVLQKDAAIIRSEPEPAPALPAK